MGMSAQHVTSVSFNGFLSSIDRLLVAQSTKDFTVDNGKFAKVVGSTKRNDSPSALLKVKEPNVPDGVLNFRMDFNEVLFKSFVIPDNPNLLTMLGKKLLKRFQNVFLEPFNVIHVPPANPIQRLAIVVMTDRIEMKLVTAEDEYVGRVLFQIIKDRFHGGFVD